MAVVSLLTIRTDSVSLPGTVRVSYFPGSVVSNVVSVLPGNLLQAN